MATALPVIQAVATIFGAASAAKTLFSKPPSSTLSAPAVAPRPVAEKPKGMPTADAATQAALLVKKRAATAQTSGRASTILSEGNQSSSTLGG